jgi:hypothetical protein
MATPEEQLQDKLDSRAQAIEAVLNDTDALERYIRAETTLRWVIEYYAVFGKLPQKVPVEATVAAGDVANESSSPGSAQMYLEELSRPSRLQRSLDAMSGKGVRDKLAYVKKHAPEIAKELLLKINDLAKSVFFPTSD